MYDQLTDMTPDNLAEDYWRDEVAILKKRVKGQYKIGTNYDQDMLMKDKKLPPPKQDTMRQSLNNSDLLEPSPIGSSNSMNHEELQSILHRFYPDPLEFCCCDEAELGKRDILLGCEDALHLSGNHWFNCLVVPYKKQYQRCRTQELKKKQRIIETFLQKVSSCGGRFVEKLVLDRDSTFKLPMEQDQYENGALTVYVPVSSTSIRQHVENTLRSP